MDSTTSGENTNKIAKNVLLVLSGKGGVGNNNLFAF